MPSAARLAPQWYWQLSGSNGYSEATQSRPWAHDPRAASTFVGRVIVVYSKELAQ